MSETLFNKIIERQIPADIVYEDKQSLAFRDINPQAPVHILVIPKKNISMVSSATKEDQLLLGHLLLVVNKIVEQEEVADAFRLVINNGASAGQTVFHLHLHILAGRDFNWPPG